VDVVVCPHCGALKRGEHWLDVGDVNGVVEHAARGSVEPGPRVGSWDASVEIVEDTPTVFRVGINASLYVEGLVTRVEASTTVRITSNVCDVCSRRHGGYYESIVQLRGHHGPLDDGSREDMTSLAYEIIDHLSSSNRQVFLAKFEEMHGGLDFYLSTTDAGRNLARELSHRTGGHMKESGRLAGRKDGKDVYRTTFSVRLPPFRKGDYLDVDGDVYRVLKVSRDRVDMLLLKTGEPVRRRRDFDDAKVICTEDDVMEAVVVFDSGEELQLMDPETYKTVQIKKPAHYEPDESVPVVRHDGQLYVA